MTSPLPLFPDTIRATLVDRPNRFVVRCRLGGRTVRAFLPNPGKLQELFIPGRSLHLTEAPKDSNRKYKLTAVAIERDGVPIVLETHKTNTVARYLIENDQVPGLEGARIIRPEVPVGRSRFDFLLETAAGQELLLEVKSCTLASGEVAMFPDAITDRGRRHLEELAHLAKSFEPSGNTPLAAAERAATYSGDLTRGRPGAVLFVVGWPDARIFSPDLHTDLAFSRTLLEVRHHIGVHAVATRWSDDLSLLPEATPCHIPWDLIEQEAHDRGSYLIMLRLSRARRIEVGALGSILFPRGHYLYVGSAMANLTKRIDRHRRHRKTFHWHIDFLRHVAQWVDVWPIRASNRLECDLAAAFAKIADSEVDRFGSSDCSCASHLLRFDEDPRRTERFQSLIAAFRMDRFGELVTPDRRGSGTRPALTGATTTRAARCGSADR